MSYRDFKYRIGNKILHQITTATANYFTHKCTAHDLATGNLPPIQTLKTHVYKIDRGNFGQAALKPEIFLAPPPPPKKQKDPPSHPNTQRP